MSYQDFLNELMTIPGDEVEKEFPSEVFLSDTTRMVERLLMKKGTKTRVLTDRPGSKTTRYKVEGVNRGTVLKREAFCQDCEERPDPMFMVKDRIWNKVVPEGGMICLECFENRMDRDLKIADFKDCPINNLVFKGYEIAKNEE